MPISHFPPSHLSSTATPMMTMSTNHWQRCWYFCPYSQLVYVSSRLVSSHFVVLSFIFTFNLHTLSSWHIFTNKKSETFPLHFSARVNFSHLSCRSAASPFQCVWMAQMVYYIRVGSKVFFFTSAGFSVWLAELKSGKQPANQSLSHPRPKRVEHNASNSRVLTWMSIKDDIPIYSRAMLRWVPSSKFQFGKMSSTKFHCESQCLAPTAVIWKLCLHVGSWKSELVCLFIGAVQWWPGDCKSIRQISDKLSVYLCALGAIPNGIYICKYTFDRTVIIYLKHSNTIHCTASAFIAAPKAIMKERKKFQQFE